MIKFLLGFLISSSFAALPTDVTQELYSPNIQVNGGGEQGIIGWTASVTKSNSNPYIGARAITVDFSSASQTLYGSLVSSSLKTAVSKVSCYVYCASGTCTHKFRAVDAATPTTVLAETAISFVTGQWVPVSLTAQSTNGVVPSFISVASNEPSISVDGCSVVPADRANIAGMAGSDWNDYTPTISACGTSTITYAQWRRVGSSMEIRAKVVTGTVTGSPMKVSLPTGYTGIASSDAVLSGVMGVSYTGGAASTYAPIMLSSDLTNVQFGRNTSTNSIYTPINCNLVNNGDSFSFATSVPIVGWSSNVTMANSSQFKISSYLANGTRVTAAPAILGEYRTRTRTASTNTLVDTTPTASPSTADGMKFFSTAYATAATSGEPVAWDIFVGKNKSIFFEWYSSTGKTGALSVDNRIVDGATGIVGTPHAYDPTTGIVSIWPNSAPTGTSGGAWVGSSGTGSTQTNGYFDIVVSENALAVGVESPATARYYASSTTISGSLATIVWTTMDWDSHSAMSSGVYTCPQTGKYHISSALSTGGTFALNSQLRMELQKNGTAVMQDQTYDGGASAGMTANVNGDVSCVVGDQLRIQVLSSATSPTIVSSNSLNYISITKVAQ